MGGLDKATEAYNWIAAHGGQVLENDGVLENVLLEQTPMGDSTYSGITEAGIVGTVALSFGDLCYFATDTSCWELVDASNSNTTSNKLGICVLAGDINAATRMLLYGKISAVSKFPTLTVGLPVYASTDAGDIQVTAPSGDGTIIRIIGYGNTADELFFCPSSNYYELGTNSLFGTLSMWAIASNATDTIKAYGVILQAAGSPVWVCDNTGDNVQLQEVIDALS